MPADDAEPQPQAESSNPEAPVDRARKELLDRILSNVAKARDNLQDAGTPAETPAVQQQVVADLETLIEMLKQNQSSPPLPQGSGGSKSDSQSSDSEKNQNQQQYDDQESESKPEKSKSQPNAQNSENHDDAEGSEERTGESRAAERRAQRQQRLENDIWGHLPPKLRDQLLNTYGERMLPQYEEFVRKFYEALSEPERTSRPR